MKGIFGLVIVLAAIGVAAYFFSPAFRTKADQVYRDKMGWDEASRRERPGEYIAWATKKLQEDIVKLEDAARNFSRNKIKLSEKLGELKNKDNQADLLLTRFKTKYSEAKAKEDANAFPVVVGDRSYTEKDLVDQVKLLLTERKGLAPVIAEVEKALKLQDEKANALVARITESKAKIPLLEAQRTLLETSQITTESETVLAQVNEVVMTNDNELAKSPVRSIDDLLKDEAKSQTVTTMDKDVEDFLRKKS